MVSQSSQQPLISQWVRRPLGNRSSLVVNSNGINIKKKTGVATKVNKTILSTIAQDENVISTSCKVVKVSPKKVLHIISCNDKAIPMVAKQLSNTTSVDASHSRQIIEHVTDVDAQDAGLPLLVSEYVQDIYQHLWNLETQHRVPEGFLQGQKVSSWMRSTVIDWLIQLQV